MLASHGRDLERVKTEARIRAEGISRTGRSRRGSTRGRCRCAGVSSSRRAARRRMSRPRDELARSSAADAPAAGELLEQRVRVGDAGDARADSARITVWIASPSTSQLASRSAASTSRVEGDLAEPALRGCRARAASDRTPTPMLRCVRRVGEVALQAARHERRGERVEQRARELEIRLGVLEPDRVDLVRHRRRARSRPATGICAEVAERDVGPDVGGEVVQDAVGVRRSRSYSSACQSWDSIWVVSGFQRRGRATRRTRARCRGQSASGSATRCAANVPVAPAELAEVLAASICARRARAGRRRPRAPCPSSSGSPAGRACARASGRPGARRRAPRARRSRAQLRQPDRRGRRRAR